MRKAVEGEDAEAIKGAMEKLTKQSHKLAEELYKQQAPGPEAAGGGAGNGGAPEGPPPPGSQGSGDVVDAEYTVKD